MRKIVFLSVIILVQGACQQSATSLVAVSSNLDSYANTRLHWGDPVSIEMETTNHDSIQLQLNGKKVAASNVTLGKENSVLGKNTLKLTVFTGAENTVREVSLLIVSSQKPQRKSYSIINTYKHDASYFTEGFYYEDGMLYEGTGLNGKSKLVTYNLASAKIENSMDLDAQFFGEGIAVVGDSIFQLTYKAQKAFIYNRTTFEKVGEFNVPFSAEGWGLCYDGKSLIMSNGSHFVYYINPKDFTYTGSLQVVDDKGIHGKLNELEYHNGKIYANVWYEKEIVVINSQTGAVEEVISLDNIPSKNFQQGVANGIAIIDGNLLITGKNWTETYELQVNDL
ncbi:glutamine cyclotransferase [Owenweeksia hongkongensis DSM 17368]|uniref:Glutamine cyclotransferase n=1 Tax=Owenweeksia hongkongensis (strain DSM 17368 / CIP 108786 / JCM 12287 / NRRL B-23963 / UST20020801) TaxID=926562 RepID=G8R7I4_OWEHD|nr:glutaminyl-peptide cyclotransferase [Owenweeksia hongkongensis]AEV32337.1 glutamine cyclotransferase [Owenweeksia hongkongensis DSM 17368]